MCRLNRLWITRRQCGKSSETDHPHFDPLIYPQPANNVARMTRIHLHLLWDSTMKRWKASRKAVISQFEDVEAIRHFTTDGAFQEHLQRILGAAIHQSRLVLFTLVNPELRRKFRASLSQRWACPMSRRSTARPIDVETYWGRNAQPAGALRASMKPISRISAIQYTIAHDDGVGPETGRDADIVLIGRVAHVQDTDVDLSRQSRLQDGEHCRWCRNPPPPENCISSSIPWSLGLTTNPERLVQIRRKPPLAQSGAGKPSRCRHFRPRAGRDGLLPPPDRG